MPTDDGQAVEGLPADVLFQRRIFSCKPSGDATLTADTLVRLTLDTVVEDVGGLARLISGTIVFQLEGWVSINTIIGCRPNTNVGWRMFTGTQLFTPKGAFEYPIGPAAVPQNCFTAAAGSKQYGGSITTNLMQYVRPGDILELAVLFKESQGLLLHASTYVECQYHPCYTPTMAFLPSLQPGLCLWLPRGIGRFQEATAALGSTPSGEGDVGRWEDKSIFGNHYSQGTTNKKPTALLNGGVLFDGINDVLEGPGYPLLTEAEIFARVYIRNDPPAAADMIGLWNFTDDALPPSAYPNVTGQIFVKFFTDDRLAGSNYSGDMRTPQIFNIASTPTHLTAWINETQVATRATNTVTPPVALTSIGQTHNASLFFLDGIIDEVLLFSKERTLSQKIEILNYLRGI